MLFPIAIILTEQPPFQVIIPDLSDSIYCERFVDIPTQAQKAILLAVKNALAQGKAVQKPKTLQYRIKHHQQPSWVWTTVEVYLP